MQRHDHGQTGFIFPAIDAFWNPAVNVQCSGYHRRRSVYRKRSTCGSWFNDCADCCFYELIYWNIPWCQCACCTFLCFGKKQRNVGNSTYIHCPGIRKRYDHGSCRTSFSRLALEIMGTPDNVIDQSTLYMRIYFLGMPFFMLYNYGAAILRAVGDTKRPLIFLIISGLANAGLNMLLVVVFNMGVAGVAIGTIVSQCISCILVLRCLYRSEGSYQLRFSKLTIKSFYLKQIFQVGIPAGIQSTVINLSNALLQSSVNSFGSIAMAGYTAANNIFGFLYVSVNSVTQSCMSFTSQNYGVRKTKRMDKVLLDCIILSFTFSFTLGCGAYFLVMNCCVCIPVIRTLSSVGLKFLPIQPYRISVAESWI